MDARRYQVSLQVLAIISEDTAAKEWNIFQHKEVKFHISKWPVDVIFLLLHKILTIHNNVLGDFMKISDHILKISEDLSKGVWRPDERFWIFFKNFHQLPKIAEDCPTNFHVSQVKVTKQKWYVHMWIKMISSHVGYHFYLFYYHFATTHYTTNF